MDQQKVMMNGDQAMQQQQPNGQQPQVIIINTNQPNAKTIEAAPQNVRPFVNGLCGCLDDCGGCIFAYFLFPCYVCSLATRLQENCCVPLFLQGGLLAMRTKFRTMYGIQGSICEDWACTTFCQQLSACQLDREMRNCGI